MKRIILITWAMGILLAAIYLPISSWLNAAGLIEVWYRLPIAPEPAVRLIAPMDELTVIAIEAASGKVYACRVVTPDALPRDQCWKQDAAYRDSAALLQSFMPNHPPGRILDSGQYRSYADDAVTDERFIILEDGSVWRSYRVLESDTTFAGFLILITLGCVLGLLAGLSLATGVLLMKRIIRWEQGRR